MQEQRCDGSEKLTDNVKMKQLFEAINNTENKIVALHKPGSIIKSRDGKNYRVDKNGAWRKIK